LLLFWAVATTAFYGVFRLGKLLCSTTSTFDGEVDLLRRDIKVLKKVGTNCPEIALKHSTTNNY